MLSKDDLKTAILQMLTDRYDDVDDAKQAWADVYDTYAMNAQDQSTDLADVTNKSGFQSGLVFVENGNASDCAMGFESAGIAYWTGATFQILMPPTLLDPLAVMDNSAVVSVPGVGLSSLLSVVFASNGDDADAKADQIATAFDTYTKTVQVLCMYQKINPVPPPPLLPGVLTLSVS